MERKGKNKIPYASTLRLAIGLGAFSVFASFFMAIYFASIETGVGTGATKSQNLEVSAGSTD